MGFIRGITLERIPRISLVTNPDLRRCAGKGWCRYPRLTGRIARSTHSTSTNRPITARPADVTSPHLAGCPGSAPGVAEQAGPCRPTCSTPTSTSSVGRTDVTSPRRPDLASSTPRRPPGAGPQRTQPTPRAGRPAAGEHQAASATPRAGLPPRPPFPSPVDPCRLISPVQPDHISRAGFSQRDGSRRQRRR